MTYVNINVPGTIVPGSFKVPGSLNKYFTYDLASACAFLDDDLISMLVNVPMPVNNGMVEVLAVPIKHSDESKITKKPGKAQNAILLESMEERALSDTVKKGVPVNCNDKMETVVDEQLELIKMRRLYQETMEKLTEVKSTKKTLEKDLECLRAEKEAKEAEKQAKKLALEARKEKRRQALPESERTKAVEDEMVHIFNQVKGSTAFIRARDRIALFLLFFFPIRVGDISCVTVQMLFDLWNGLSIHFKRKKKGKTVLTSIRTMPRRLKWFEFCGDDFEIIFNSPDFKLDDYFYKTSREVMTKRLNTYFKAVSKDTKKILRSYSVYKSKIKTDDNILKVREWERHYSICASESILNRRVERREKEEDDFD